MVAVFVLKFPYEIQLGDEAGLYSIEYDVAPFTNAQFKVMLLVVDVQYIPPGGLNVHEV